METGMANAVKKKARFPIGKWSREFKEKKNVLVQANESIRSIQNKINIANGNYENLKKETAVLEDKVIELKRKVR